MQLAGAGLINGSYSMASCFPGTGYPAPVITPSEGGFTMFSAVHSGSYVNNGTRTYVNGGGLWFRAGSPYRKVISLCQGGNSLFSMEAGLTAEVLFLLDTKIDDGLPFTGSVRLMGQDGALYPNDVMCDDSTLGAYGMNCTADTTSYSCANNTVGTNVYLTSQKSQPRCPYAVRAQ